MKNNQFWEMIGYITLALCILGQVIVGRWYIIAQTLYLIANCGSTARDFALNLPRANKVRDIAFTAITLALLIVRIF